MDWKQRIMRHSFAIVLLLSAAFALLQGCERKAPEDSSKATAKVPSDAATESKIGMVQIPGGRFMMGDKDRTKKAYQKALELNPGDTVIRQFMDAQGW